MTNILVIGGTTEGGIGYDFATTTMQQMPFGASICAPSPERLDVTDQGSIVRYLADNGPFDQIVYSAGVSMLKWVHEMSSQDYQKVFAVNTFGPALVAGEHQARFPNHNVSMVIVCSDAADTPMRTSLAYCASKAAAEMVVRCLARELYPQWRVNGVSPGVVDGTGMTKTVDESVPEIRGWTPNQARAYEMKSNILGRRVYTEEITETIQFLLEGPDALNGHIITINGGK